MTEKELDKFIEQDEQNEKIKDQIKQEKVELENILKIDDGLKLLARIIFGKCFINSNAYTNDTSATSFNLGRQSIGQELIQEVKNIDVKYVERLYRIEKGE